MLLERTLPGVCVAAWEGLWYGRSQLEEEEEEGDGLRVFQLPV